MGFKKPEPPAGWKPDRADQHLDAIRAEAEYQRAEWMLETPLETIMAGICMMVNRGAAVVLEGVVVFWHSGKARYQPYDEELNAHLLRLLGEFQAMSSSGACH